MKKDRPKLRDGKLFKMAKEKFPDILGKGIEIFGDLTGKESIENLVEWIQSYWQLNGHGKVPLVIVGAKSDLRDNPAFPTQVSARHGKDYAKELSKLLKNKYGFSVHYIETSAKENVNIEKAFRILANEIIASTTFQEKKRNDRKTSTRKIINDRYGRK